MKPRIDHILALVWVIWGIVLLLSVWVVGKTTFTSVFAKAYIFGTPACLAIMLALQKVAKK